MLVILLFYICVDIYILYTYSISLILSRQSVVRQELCRYPVIWHIAVINAKNSNVEISSFGGPKVIQFGNENKTKIMFQLDRIETKLTLFKKLEHAIASWPRIWRWNHVFLQLYHNCIIASYDKFFHIVNVCKQVCNKSTSNFICLHRCTEKTL